MRNRIFLLTGLIVGFLFFKILAVGAEMTCSSTGDIRINKVSTASSYDDWVELFNLLDNPFDLSGFGVRDNLSSSAVGYFSNGTIINKKLLVDLSGRLNKSGDDVKLIDNNDQYRDECVYNTDVGIDFVWARVPDGVGDWQSMATSSLSDEYTSTSLMAQLSQTRDVSILTEPTSPLSSPTSTSTTMPDYLVWQNLKLNEIVSDPATGTEQVEIFNIGTSSIDLSGGLICDNRDTTSTCKIATGTVVAGGWVVIDLETASFLNNDGDSVILRDPNAVEIDKIIYSGNSVSEKNESLARSVDGAGSWQITRSITLGSANIIVARPVAQSPGGGNGSNNSNSTVTSISSAPASTTIVINEIYPDPAGADNDDEFIEIYNFGSVAVDLGGWKIKDNEKSFNLSSNLAAGAYLILKRPDTGISLNNTTPETVILVDAWTREADKISYERAQTGSSYNRTADGWLWSSAITAGAKNIIEEEDAVGVIWKILAPDSGEPDELLKFSVVGSVDPRGGQLNYLWKFASGTEFVGPLAEYKFATSGIYEVVLNASSSAGTSGVKKISVKIGAGLSVQNVAVGITEILPNPDGTDDAEYIELFNFGSSTVSLANWIVRVDTKSYMIPEKTNLAPNSSLIFYRAATKIALNNAGGKVSLLTPAGDTVDFIKYDKAISGKSFSLVNNIWQWVVPSPGAVATLSLPARGGEAEGVGAVLGVKISSATKSTGYFVPNTIVDAREKEKDAKVKVRGVVTVLPNIFGSQYFYISDGTSGIQIYQNKKDFPELKIGDEIEVSGAVSEASGQKRVRATRQADMRILGGGKNIVPTETVIGEWEEFLGGLVKIIGDVTEIKSNYMYLDDGASEAVVLFKTGAKIDKKLFKEGDKVAVVGILENSKDGFQIWPRSQGDIEVIGVAPEVAGVKIASVIDWKTYSFMGLSASGAVLLGWLAREWEKVLKFLKKIFKV